jgi:hypothetical protein
MANSRWLEQYAGLYIGDHWKTSLHFIPERAPTLAGAGDGYCGISWPTKVRKFIGNFCTMIDMADVPITPVSENTYMGGGKTPTKRSLGLKIDPFVVNFGELDRGTLRALMGETQSASTRNATKLKSPTFRSAGHLLLKSYDPDTNLPKIEILIMDVQMTIKTLTGITSAAGERVYPVEISSESTNVYIADHANNGQSFFVEGWYDNAGTDINANWSGSETTVVLGTGNASYASATTPVALPIDTSDTSLVTYQQYLIRASIDGTQVATGAMSFATSTMTFSPAYSAANTALLVIYIANSGTYDNPNFSGAAQPSEIRDMWYGWGPYMRA